MADQQTTRLESRGENAQRRAYDFRLGVVRRFLREDHRLWGDRQFAEKLFLGRPGRQRPHHHQLGVADVPAERVDEVFETWGVRAG